MRLVDLTERRVQRTSYAFHGTSSVFLRSILKHGLIPNPPNRMFSDEPDGDLEDMTHVESLPRVYLTYHHYDAWENAKRVVEKFGGKPIVIIVQFTKLSTNVDEDEIYYWFQDILEGIDLDNILGYESLDNFLDQVYQGNVETEAIEELKFRFEDKFRTSRDAPILKPIMNIFKIIAKTKVKQSAYWRDWLKDIKRSQYWDDFRNELFKLTSITGEPNSIGKETLAINRPIKFRGKTKIVGILGGTKNDPNILWGVTPDDFTL